MIYTRHCPTCWQLVGGLLLTPALTLPLSCGWHLHSLAHYAGNSLVLLPTPTLAAFPKLTPPRPCSACPHPRSSPCRSRKKIADTSTSLPIMPATRGAGRAAAACWPSKQSLNFLSLRYRFIALDNAEQEIAYRCVIRCCQTEEHVLVTLQTNLHRW